MKNSLKKIKLLLIITFIIVAAIPQITYAQPEFTLNSINIPSEWAKEEIDKAKELNLLTKKLEGEYRKSITREEFSELSVKLYEALAGEEGKPPEENPFTDTQNTKILMATYLGIVNGRGDGTFAPNDMVTREEVSVMLYRTLQAAKPDYNYTDIPEYGFKDYNIISSWAREPINYLYGIGIINGVGDNRFDPVGDTSREEAIVVVKRMFEKIERSSRNNLTVSRGGRRKPENIIKLEKLISQEMGKPYKWGATGPDSYDCSGFVYSIFGKLGISLPRVSSDQAKAGTYVSKENLTYGDIVCFARDGQNVNHVGIYVGDGKFVHSPQTGDVVKTTTLMSGYYKDSYYTARRVFP